ncbi:hypothetical protein CONCODRAFT_167558 [Conidiobolus coronatus NRRL 28638]|uniref:Uncharacterized protein n=1 Tax=Conidiobolus coronatus (strain ATCC 28846 / CBS 209.66 / NRRL 28638) TaxID=796925 RepID=A0A137PE28_CONC2|nr:hypothetical protein CONCODRAFT_167558 [Conidiobolus coronatus NRRL 28638]|eukprot:KXN73222.1 hypothetical protein CONCODRAFT_167558 [Conidiobolus coronatus NRRL 28638]
MDCQDNTNSFNFGDDTLAPSYNMAKYSISKLYRDGGIHSQKNFINGYQKCFIDLLTMINIAGKHHQRFTNDDYRGQVSFKALMVDFFEARGVSTEEMMSLLQHSCCHSSIIKVSSNDFTRKREEFYHLKFGENQLQEISCTSPLQTNYSLNVSRALLRQVQLPIHLETLKKNAIQKHSTQNISNPTKRKKAKLLLAACNKMSLYQIPLENSNNM